MTRREVLAVLFALGFVGCGADGEPSPEALALAALLPTGEQPIGAWYLADHPEEDDVAGLVAALGGPAGPRESVARRIVRLIQEDFREGRTVQVRGWVLARSECRLAALAHRLTR